MNISSIMRVITISFLAIGCSPPDRLISDGTYNLSHSYLNSDTTKMIPGPDNYFVIEGDSVFYYEFEPYIKPKIGLISGSFFLFDLKDSVRFKITTTGIIVKGDSISTIYQKK